MSLPEGEIQCPICMEPPENAVECLKCKNYFCEKCVKQQKSCPTCKSTPFKTQINEALRRVIERLRVPCEYCNRTFPKGELQIHMKNCEKRPKKCSVGKCQFSAQNKEDAVAHFGKDHKDFIWDNFQNFPMIGKIIYVDIF